MNNLMEFEIEEMNEVMQEEITGFVVDSLDTANWCFRKLQNIKKAIAENDALAQAEIDRITAWRDRENKMHEESVAFFEHHLTEYFKQLRASNPKSKLSTPYGKVTTRKTQKYTYDDETLIRYAKVNNIPCVKVTESLMKTEFKKLCPGGVNPETGEVIGGVTVEEIESISIKLD